MPRNAKTLLLATVIAAALMPTPPLAAKPAPQVALPSDACAAMKRHMSEKPAARPDGPPRALSNDSKEVLGKIASMGDRNGSAAPNAQAQAMLNMMGAMFASRSDIPAQSSAEYMRMMGAKPGANVAADMKALGC